MSYYKTNCCRTWSNKRRNNHEDEAHVSASTNQTARDGCTFMCDKQYVFYDTQNLEKLLEFSQMSMVDGLKDYLIKEWCSVSLGFFIDADKPKVSADLRGEDIIPYYTIALKYEEKRSIRLSEYSYGELNMKERCEVAFDESKKKIILSGLNYFTAGLSYIVKITGKMGSRMAI